jgi:hypothetical protein
MNLLRTAIDAPPSYNVKEITIDLISRDNFECKSLLCSHSATIQELKQRILALCNDNNIESVQLYYCGQSLLDTEKLPFEIFDDDDVFNPRCKYTVYDQ